MGISNRRSSSSLCGWVFTAAFIVICSSRKTTAEGRPVCTPSSCGNILNISYPFRLKHDPSHCGIPRFTLSCENNITVLKPSSSGQSVYVQEINYDEQIIRVVGPGFDKSNCSSLPLLSFDYTPYDPSMITSQKLLLFLKCDSPLNSSLYVDAAPCFPFNATSSSSSSPSSLSTSQPKTYGYVHIGELTYGDWKGGCRIEGSSYASLFYDGNTSYKSIINSMLHGFELKYTLYTGYTGYTGDPCEGQWITNSKCYPHGIRGLIGLILEVIHGLIGLILEVIHVNAVLFAGRTLSYWNTPRWLAWWPFKPIKGRWVPPICIGLLFLARMILGVPITTAFLIYKWRRRHLSMYSTIEDFLQSDNNFLPIRYSYSEIKKMTRKFKDKLGEGGYGSVYKAKLRSGRFVAIKILGKPKGNGQDFTNEVATIGRIHHVNVVQLIGYCVEGSKRALVYDFMPNGSLDKYIHLKEGSIPLSCKQMHEISLGVAQGIDYLHQGCEMQILHFDIKPHNILLDENFSAKVSDFGLAKLYPVDNSIVSLTAVRGTLGYIAPELFYKNIGGVSYKADVYSFGMLLMEIARRRRNLNALAEHSSQIYFPSWVYDQYNEGKDWDMGEVIEEEEQQIIKKMVITALWCIQMKPSDRPSMKKVIEMLEGDVELLQMPPKPLICPRDDMPVGDLDQDHQNPTCSNTELTSSLSPR